MRVVSLLPLTKRAKQIVKQHGERWEVVRRQPYVLFAPERGPWLLVQPLTEERAPANDVRSARVETASRWVHEFNDENFKVAP
ncbi:hypothetical protein [Massilia sp. X63]|uniref:hypothetical protein n=1 Tax=Massilia sp. X63 TaxID=3237285 RepID=UPI0034DD1F55